MLYTEEVLMELPEEFKGFVTGRWNELVTEYDNRLDAEFERIKKIGGDDLDRLSIFQITTVKRQVKDLLDGIENALLHEKEICEIHRIKHSGDYVLLIGPISERRMLKAFHGIEI